jgi:coenzyme F420-reducing hydrogenase beta subunit
MVVNDKYCNNKFPAIKIIGREKCTGCFGCANSCKHSAIEMKLSEEGFYEPKIIESKCTNCGLCTNNCPIISFKANNFKKEDIKTYAAFSTNDMVRLNSSSGGIFSEIAEIFIENHGIVFGAAWGKDLTVKHILVKDKAGLSQLRSSKYIQSNLDKIYLEIVHMVEKEGQKVLFTGTPCEVAALKTFTNSENLFTADVVCHGIPSKMVFDKYISYIAKEHNVISYTFRDKSIGWSKYKVKMEIDGAKPYECITRQDPFFHGFICDLYSNLACYNCKFASIPRPSDITMGDFWKISDDLMDERGVSVVLANNTKGISLLHKLQKENKIKLFHKNLEDAVKGNPRIHNGFLNMRKKRSEILSKAKEEGFEYIYKNYIEKTERYVYD